MPRVCKHDERATYCWQCKADRIEQLEAALRESVKAMEYAKGYLDVPGSFNPMNNHPATVLYNAIGPARALIGEAK